MADNNITAEPKVCRVEGCTQQDQRQGLCFKHLPEYGTSFAVQRIRPSCSVAGCTKNAIRSGGKCTKHGGFRGKRCGHEGCPNRSVKGGVCMRHGAKQTICKHEGCDRYAKIGGVCIRHGAKVRQCSVDGCGKNATKKGKCWAHGGRPDGVSPKHNRPVCSHEGCKNDAKVYDPNLCAYHGKKVNNTGGTKTSSGPPPGMEDAEKEAPTPPVPSLPAWNGPAINDALGGDGDKSDESVEGNSPEEETPHDDADDNDESVEEDAPKEETDSSASEEEKEEEEEESEAEEDGKPEANDEGQSSADESEANDEEQSLGEESESEVEGETMLCQPIEEGASEDSGQQNLRTDARFKGEDDLPKDHWAKLEVKKSGRKTWKGQSLCRATEECTRFARKAGLCCRHGAPQKQCSVDGCSNTAPNKKGLCWSHGGRPPDCSFEGCTNISHSRGLCGKHGGRGLHSKHIQWCSVDGCNKNAVSMKDVCWSHGGRPEDCSVEGCTNISYKKGGVCGRRSCGRARKRRRTNQPLCSREGCKNDANLFDPNLCGYHSLRGRNQAR